ncbi:uncharacterized protein HMPREF1541_09314 [Cyphellophora europaea CBS 101466]|uniref:Kinesin motor domain-containing protein n=1 Tax=Cyphellophora europaea (strain CBS 101466) TaxID=1220924 RepID=W2S9X4_CYPE1|nr:uncharacterized protein HMPREF1541_09314 [Cyphellophora europaea CBS 101466]ETN45482.1 hypothetical protein HMPREF1541_09314 [Cyphellophora europaea CBS 101466]
MSVRVVARIRPLLKTERTVDEVLSAHGGADDKTSIVKIPNPKNFAEEYSFQFNSVYGQDSTQQQIFEAEVSPAIKHLFQGLDVTIFAYGSTGTGKTHTMRGGKSLTDRGLIPRLLSNIYRKSKAIEKNNDGATTVEVSMSYYEIYNDRVFDLFQSPESRTATGLPIREAEGGKTVVVGLSEEPCSCLKDFELLYDKANANRSTGATKLNAHSSRSHAILCVKVTIKSPTETRVSTASCIDLAGSEDNRRTGNGKERMVESASINKSLFVLAQCVEAISKHHPRIPFRESKMTRILSLGQNNGITIMILNLASTKSFHLDTLSSLNFANRTKKIEVKEVENEPIFKGPPVKAAGVAVAGPNIQRQPLRSLTHVVNVNLNAPRDPAKDKPLKAFSVYSDRSKANNARHSSGTGHKTSPLKRTADTSMLCTRPAKSSRPNPGTTHMRPRNPTNPSGPSVTEASIESIVERKVSEMLANRALGTNAAPQQTISAEVQKRLDEIEKRLEGQEGERAEGLSYLFMAKQHQARGEDVSALRMYNLAKPYFEGNEKLDRKIERLKEKIEAKRDLEQEQPTNRGRDVDADESYVDENGSNDAYASDASDASGPRARPRGRKHAPPARRPPRQHTSSPDPLASDAPPITAHAARSDVVLTPRTKHILSIINSRDVAQIKKLHGVGPRKAEGIVDYLAELDEEIKDGGGWYEVRDWESLKGLRGLGARGLGVMREGVAL